MRDISTDSFANPPEFWGHHDNRGDIEGCRRRHRHRRHAPNGSWDLDDLAGLKQTPKFIYVIELKYDATPEQALRQIEEKGYARKFAVDSRRLFKIGVNFSSEKRRIVSWRIAE